MTISLLAVLSAAVLRMLVGNMWYGPLFGSAWLASIGKTRAMVQEESKGRSMALTIITAFAGSIVTAIILSVFIGIMGSTGFAGGAWIGFLAWIGFMAPLQLGIVLWEQRSLRWFLITTSYELLMMVLMGGMLTAF